MISLKFYSMGEKTNFAFLQIWSLLKGYTSPVLAFPAANLLKTKVYDLHEQHVKVVPNRKPNIK